LVYIVYVLTYYEINIKNQRNKFNKSNYAHTYIIYYYIMASRPDVNNIRRIEVH